MIDGKNQIPKNQARGDALRPLFYFQGTSIYLNHSSIPSWECPYYPEPRAGIPPCDQYSLL